MDRRQNNAVDRRDFLKVSAAGSVAAGFGIRPQAAPETVQDTASRGLTKSPPGLRFRQVHLDFHTSEAIPEVGSEFDPEEFAATLERARVDSVTCFARCHHGWIYYNTKAFPERRHPTLKRGLLEEQIKACHARNIRVPIYVTVQWDHYTATHHPEWLSVTAEGRIQGTPPLEPGFYRQLCLNSPYVDFLRKHLIELFETVPVDGLFLDIVKPQDCLCTRCLAGMAAEKLDPRDTAARKAFGLAVTNKFTRETSELIRRYGKDCTIFYNSGHVGARHRPVKEAYTHFELESLPSGGWGYLHFPSTVRYARNLGADCLGMTGKFHTSWGDFHSFKNPAALEFECFNSLALGARCSIGDQLHPKGKMDQATYELIGSVFSRVEAKEAWCYAARPLTDIGVLTLEEVAGEDLRAAPSMLGFTRMLQEGAHQFDILDSSADYSRYRLLILPDEITVTPEQARKLDEYVDHGGSLLASFRSGLPKGTPPEKPAGEFLVKSLGIRAKGEAPFSPDFLLPGGSFATSLPATEHVMYLRGLEVEPVPAAETLADAVVPYFNRTFEHFCSHRHTPSAGKKGYPGIVRLGRSIYFAHPVFTQYYRNAPAWCKTLVLGAIRLLLPDPLVRLDNAPSSTLVTLNEQAADSRLVLHLLHYVPERRGQDFDIVEDVIPIYEVKVSVRAGRPIRKVQMVPEMKILQFRENAGRVEFTVPKVLGHQIVELEL